jgi:hypothetical protein
MASVGVRGGGGGSRTPPHAKVLAAAWHGGLMGLYNSSRMPPFSNACRACGCSNSSSSSENHQLPSIYVNILTGSYNPSRMPPFSTARVADACGWQQQQ